MAIIYDLSSGTFQSKSSREGGSEHRCEIPDDRADLQLATQETATAEPRTHADPAHLVCELLKKL